MIERPHIKQGQLAEWIPQHADKAPPKATRAGPMFSYFGSKWKGARHFGAPREALVIEPFAGSACYSLRYRAPKVKLYDKPLQIVKKAVIRAFFACKCSFGVI